MFTIYGGKTEFKQWDLDQKVVNPNMCDCEQVIFTMSNGRVGISRAYEYEGQMVADVPNHLLQYSGNVMVDLGQGAEQRIEEKTFFTVVECDKPEGYVCTPNRNLAKKYLETVAQELTEAEKAQVRKNIGAGEGGGSGGVTSWNDLPGRPFGDNRTEETVNIEWDGNTDGLEESSTSYKVSDRVPTGAEIKTGTVIVDNRGTDVVIDLSKEELSLLGDGYCFAGLSADDATPTIVVVTTDTDGCSPGIYFHSFAGIVTKSLTYTAKTGEVDTIDYMFMPDGYPQTEVFEETLFETELAGGMAEFASDAVTLVEGETYTVTLDSGTYASVCKKTNLEGMELLYLGNASQFEQEDTGESYCVATIVGITSAVLDNDGGSYFKLSKRIENITPMAAKFMPNPSDLSAEWIAALKTALGI